MSILKGKQLFYKKLEMRMQGIQYLEHKQWLKEKIKLIDIHIKEVKIKELIQDI
ncbi:TPA: hypothetical protein QC104_006007 [Bacillus cereus]|nr:hypothetical protein [Bacillus cereus]